MRDPPIFDGHNDVLLDTYLAPRGGRAFVDRTEEGHLDLPRAREAGFHGGLFAIYVPADPAASRAPRPRPPSDHVFERDVADAIPRDHAARFAGEVLDHLDRIEANADGAILRGTSTADLRRSLREDRLALVLHLEGAEPLAPDLSDLDVWTGRGLASVGLTWARRNAFATGAPFHFPASPDVGPGLTDAGVRLVRALGERGVVVDCAHLNLPGVRDVVATTDQPLVFSHTGVHALCPSSRNVTDEEVRLVADTGGVVGITPGVIMVRPDGCTNPDTPLGIVADHVDHVVQVAGIEHAALGSDLDGTMVPDAIRDVRDLRKLLDLLRDRGYTKRDLEHVAYRNWHRVLEDAWGA